MEAPYCERERRIVAARVSESALPGALQPYPPDKDFCRQDDTPQKIAEMFGVDLDVSILWVLRPVRRIIFFCSLLTL